MFFSWFPYGWLWSIIVDCNEFNAGWRNRMCMRRMLTLAYKMMLLCAFAETLSHLWCIFRAGNYDNGAPKCPVETAFSLSNKRLFAVYGDPGRRVQSEV